MKKLILFIVLAIFLSGCYWRIPVLPNERGLELERGVSIQRVLPPGRYGPSSDWYGTIVRINCDVRTINWTPIEAELVTKDKQPIGMTLSVSYSRDCTADRLKEMYSNYQPEAVSDEALSDLVLSRVPRVAKQITPEFTLDQMLGIAEGDNSGRGLVTSLVSELLSDELDEFYVRLVDVGINNINPSDSYLNLLQQKADAQVAVEVAVEQTKLAEQELLREEKKTLVEVELARRENLVNEELAKVYEQSPQFYELERLTLLADVVGENDKVYFIPEGTDLTLFLGSANTATTLPKN